MNPSTASSPLLDIDSLTVAGNPDPRLQNVTLQVARGALHVIIGPNGAGKSTLLSAVLGLVPFQGGIVANWAGVGTIGYVPQSFHVDPTLPVTVRDFLALTRQRRPVCLGITRASTRRIAEALARVGLAGLEHKQLATLSGGELRRVLLAHALDPEPELLLLDEPTTGLDDEAARWLDETLTQIVRERRTTILMVSHDLERVGRLADRVTVLDRRVLVEGEPIEVLSAAPVGGIFTPGRHGLHG